MIDQINPSSWFNKTPLKITAWLVLCVFLFNTLAVDSSLAEIVSARQNNLSIWSFAERDTLREALMKTYIDSRLVRIADTLFDMEQLARYQADALFQPSGRYLIEEATKKDPVKFMRAVTNEDFWVLWRQEERSEATRSRYLKLRDEILDNSAILSSYNNLLARSGRQAASGANILEALLANIMAVRSVPKDDARSILFNDMMARAFELDFLLNKEKVVTKSEVKTEDLAFLDVMRLALDRLEPSNASANDIKLPIQFFDKVERMKHILRLQEKKQGVPATQPSPQLAPDAVAGTGSSTDLKTSLATLATEQAVQHLLGSLEGIKMARRGFLKAALSAALAPKEALKQSIQGAMEPDPFADLLRLTEPVLTWRYEWDFGENGIYTIGIRSFISSLSECSRLRPGPFADIISTPRIMAKLCKGQYRIDEQESECRVIEKFISGAADPATREAAEAILKKFALSYAEDAFYSNTQSGVDYDTYRKSAFDSIMAFSPQLRARLFLVAVRNRIEVANDILTKVIISTRDVLEKARKAGQEKAEPNRPAQSPERDVTRATAVPAEPASPKPEALEVPKGSAAATAQEDEFMDALPIPSGREYQPYDPGDYVYDHPYRWFLISISGAAANLAVFLASAALLIALCSYPDIGVFATVAIVLSCGYICVSNWCAFVPIFFRPPTLTVTRSAEATDKMSMKKILLFLLEIPVDIPHELGHWLICKLFGIKTRLHLDSINLIGIKVSNDDDRANLRWSVRVMRERELFPFGKSAKFPTDIATTVNGAELKGIRLAILKCAIRIFYPFFGGFPQVLDANAVVRNIREVFKNMEENCSQMLLGHFAKHIAQSGLIRAAPKYLAILFSILGIHAFNFHGWIILKPYLIYRSDPLLKKKVIAHELGATFGFPHDINNILGDLVTGSFSDVAYKMCMDRVNSHVAAVVREGRVGISVDVAAQPVAPLPPGADADAAPGTPGEERKISLGDKDIKEVERQISKNLKKIYPWIDEETISSYAFVGIANALEKFDPTRTPSLKIWISRKGKYEAIDAMRADGIVRRGGRKKAPQVHPFDALEDSRGDLLSEAELISDKREERPGMSIENLDELEKIFHLFSPAAVIIMKLYYLHQLTMKEIASFIGISESRVSQLYKEIMADVSRGRPSKINFSLGASKINPGFGQRIRDAREALPMERGVLADEVGVPEPVLIKWEEEKDYPKYNQWVYLVRALGVTESYLLEGKPLRIWESLRKRGIRFKLTSPLHIVQWFNTGEGLNPGDYIIATVNLGWEKKFCDWKNQTSARFVFNMPGKRGEKADVVFVAEKDKNHGLLFNCYYLDNQRQQEGSAPFASFKYLPSAGRIVKINLAACDILYTAYALHPICSLARPFRAEITKFGHVWVGAYKIEDSSYHAFVLKIPEKRFKKEGLAHKAVVAVVGDDKNHGQIINVYLAGDYDANKRDRPIATYRYSPALEPCPPEFRRIIAQNLAVLDIIAAFEGKPLEVFGREARAKIRKVTARGGICGVNYNVTPNHMCRAEFAVPKQYVGQYAVIKVEMDINQGQAINLYLDSDLKDARLQPKPISTYKYLSGARSYHKKGKIGMCRQVDLAALDIQDYYYGRADLKLQEGRAVELRVNYAPRKDGSVYFRAVTKTTRPFSKLIVFMLSSIAREIFLPWQAPQVVTAILKEDPDYGLYIEITRNGVVLATYYYAKDKKCCVPIDFSRTTFFDYILGNKNIHGAEILPRQCQLPYKVTKRGRIVLAYKNMTLEVFGLRRFKGMDVVLVPVKDGRYGYVVQVHDAAGYSENKQRQPEVILRRDAHYRDLTPISGQATYSYRRKKSDKKRARGTDQPRREGPIRGRSPNGPDGMGDGLVPQGAGVPEPVVRHSIIDMGGYKQVLISASPTKGGSLEEQGAELLSNIDKVLSENGCDRDSVVKQIIFLKDISDRKKCEEIMGKHYARGPPATSYIQQPPISGEAIAIEILAIPKRDGIEIKRINSNLTIFEQGGMRWAYIAGAVPDDGIEDTYEQALNTLRKMQGLLEANGFKFDQVVRTWIYENNIVGINKDGRQRYQLFNDARKVFFDTGNGGEPIQFADARPPASTGIGMSGGSFVMECLAIDGKGSDLQILPIENPEQTSAYKYTAKVLKDGATPQKKAPPLFSRGMAIVSGDFQTILISGTASVKGEKVVHVGDVERQTETTIENIGLVLGQVGTTIKDIPQARVYIKNKKDYEKVRRIVEARLPNIPCLYLIGDVCRPEWLVEIEAIAYSVKQPPSLPDPIIKAAEPSSDIMHREKSIIGGYVMRLLPSWLKKILLRRLRKDAGESSPQPAALAAPGNEGQLLCEYPYNKMAEMLKWLEEKEYITGADIAAARELGGFENFFQEAIRNSLEAVGRREGIAKEAPTDVRIRAFMRNGELWFQVIDNGVGFTEYELARVGRERYSHTGLASRGANLAQIAQAAEALKWRLVFENRKDGPGACVSLVIPRVASSAVSGSDEKRSDGSVPELLQKTRELALNLKKYVGESEFDEILGVAERLSAQGDIDDETGRSLLRIRAFAEKVKSSLNSINEPLDEEAKREQDNNRKMFLNSLSHTLIHNCGEEISSASVLAYVSFSSRRLSEDSVRIIRESLLIALKSITYLETISEIRLRDYVIARGYSDINTDILPLGYYPYVANPVTAKIKYMPALRKAPLEVAKDAIKLLGRQLDENLSTAERSLEGRAPAIDSPGWHNLNHSLQRCPAILLAFLEAMTRASQDNAQPENYRLLMKMLADDIGHLIGNPVSSAASIAQLIDGRSAAFSEGIGHIEESLKDTRKLLKQLSSIEEIRLRIADRSSGITYNLLYVPGVRNIEDFPYILDSWDVPIRYAPVGKGPDDAGVDRRRASEDYPGASPEPGPLEDGDGDTDASGFRFYRDFAEALKIFREGNHIKWPRTTLAMRREFVNILARSLEKDPGALIASDFMRPIPEFNEKRLISLLMFYYDKRGMGLPKALKNLKSKLGIKETELVIVPYKDFKEALTVFRNGNIKWSKTTPGIRREFVNMLARSLKKDPGALTIVDFKETIPEFKGKMITRLLIVYCSDRSISLTEALKNLKSKLGIKETELVIVPYEDFKEALTVFRNGNIKWSKTTPGIRREFVNMLARLRQKEPGAINTEDFRKHIPEFKGKSMSGLLAIYYDGAGIKQEESIRVLKSELGITDSWTKVKWTEKKKDWEKVCRIIKETMDAAVNTANVIPYLEKTALTSEADIALGREVVLGDSAARQALIEAHKKDILNLAKYMARHNRDVTKDELFSAGLYALSRSIERYDPEQKIGLWGFVGSRKNGEGRYIIGRIEGAMRDYIRVKRGSRRKHPRDKKTYTGIEDGNGSAGHAGYMENVPERTDTGDVEQAEAEQKRKIELAKNLLKGEVSNRDLEIFITYLKGEKQYKIAPKFNLGAVRVSQILKNCRNILAKQSVKSRRGGGEEEYPYIAREPGSFEDGDGNTDASGFPLYRDFAKALSEISKFSARDFDFETLRRKARALLAYRGPFENGVHDFVYASVIDMALFAGPKMRNDGRVLGLAGEISGLYEMLIKRPGTTLRDIDFGRLQSLDKVVENGLKEFDAISDNTVFEFKFHLTLRKLYQQVIGVDPKRIPHLKVLTKYMRFNYIRNIVYFGEVDGGQIVKALTKFLEKRPELKNRVVVTPKGGVSVKLDLYQIRDFLYSRDTIACARREESGHWPVFLSRGLRDSSKEIKRLIKAKTKQLKGRSFDVIIAISKALPQDVEDLRKILLLDKPERADQKLKVLVVCYENRERSPLAASMIRNNLPPDLADDIEIRSAGIGVTEAESARGLAPHEEDLAKRHPILRGRLRDGQLKRAVTRELVDWADLILVAQDEYVAGIKNKFKTTGKNIELILGTDQLQLTAEDYPEDPKEAPYGRITGIINAHLGAIIDRLRIKLSEKHATVPAPQAVSAPDAGPSIEIIRAVPIPQDKPVMAIFDVHTVPSEIQLSGEKISLAGGLALPGLREITAPPETAPQAPEPSADVDLAALGDTGRLSKFVTLPENPYLSGNDCEILMAAVDTWDNDIRIEDLDKYASAVADTIIREAARYRAATGRTPKIALLSYHTTSNKDKPLEALEDLNIPLSEIYGDRFFGIKARTKKEPRLSKLCVTDNKENAEFEKAYIQVIERAVRIAGERAKAKGLEIIIVGRGNIQFDAAIMRDVYPRKTGLKTEEGKFPPNVLIFPNRQSYKSSMGALRLAQTMKKAAAPSGVLAGVYERLRALPSDSLPEVIFPETIDAKNGGLSKRVISAALEAAKRNSAKVTLVSHEGGEILEQFAEAVSLIAEGRLRIIDPRAVKKNDETGLKANLSASRSLLKEARDANRPCALVAGAELETSDVVIFSAWFKAKGIGDLFDYFLMIFPDPSIGEGGAVLYVNTAVQECPDANGIRDAASSAAGAFRGITSKKPRVALITTGKKSLDKMSAAWEIMKKEKPDLDIGSGPIGLEEALSQGFNVVVFPDLMAGNICYKLTERMLGVKALGPIILGPTMPISDLSRGAKQEDIRDTAALLASIALDEHRPAPAAPVEPNPIAPETPPAEAIKAVYTRSNERHDGLGLSSAANDQRLQSNLIKAITGGASGLDILSIGCGWGEIEGELIDRGNSVKAIDLTPGNVELARRRGIDAIEADAHHLPAGIREKKYDAIVFSESIGHMNARQVLAGIKDLLKPGGRIIITLHIQGDSPRYDESLRYIYYSPDEIVAILKDLGLSAEVSIDGDRSYKGEILNRGNLVFIQAKAAPPAVTVPAEGTKVIQISKENLNELKEAVMRVIETARGLKIKTIITMPGSGVLASRFLKRAWDLRYPQDNVVLKYYSEAAEEENRKISGYKGPYLLFDDYAVTGTTLQAAVEDLSDEYNLKEDVYVGALFSSETGSFLPENNSIFGKIIPLSIKPFWLLFRRYYIKENPSADIYYFLDSHPGILNESLTAQEVERVLSETFPAFLDSLADEAVKNVRSEKDVVIYLPAFAINGERPSASAGKPTVDAVPAASNDPSPDSPDRPKFSDTSSGPAGESLQIIPAKECKYKAFIFDLGKVLCDFDHSKMTAGFKPYTRLREKQFLKRLESLRVRRPASIGSINNADFIKAVKKELELEGIDDETFTAIYNDIFTDNPEMFDLVKRLKKAGYKVAILSDITTMHYEHMLATLPIIQDLDGFYVSCKLGMTKPEEGTYLHVINALGVAPEEAVFVDDTAVNAEAAKRLKLAGIQFKGIKSLTDELLKLGVMRSSLEPEQLQKLDEIRGKAYTAIVLDADGTLTDFAAREVPDELIVRLAKLIDQKTVVAISTGRIGAATAEEKAADYPDIEEIFLKIRTKVINEDNLQYLVGVEQSGVYGFNGFIKGDPRREEFNAGFKKVDRKLQEKIWKKLSGQYPVELDHAEYKSHGLAVHVKLKYATPKFMTLMVNEVKDILRKRSPGLECSRAEKTINISPEGAKKSNAFKLLRSRFGITEDNIISAGDAGSPEGNDYCLAERKGGFCVGDYFAPGSMQISTLKAIGLKHFEASIWLIDNLKFEPAPLQVQTDPDLPKFVTGPAAETGPDDAMVERIRVVHHTLGNRLYHVRGGLKSILEDRIRSEDAKSVLLRDIDRILAKIESASISLQRSGMDIDVKKDAGSFVEASRELIKALTPETTGLLVKLYETLVKADSLTPSEEAARFIKAFEWAIKFTKLMLVNEFGDKRQEKSAIDIHEILDAAALIEDVGNRRVRYVKNYVSGQPYVLGMEADIYTVLINIFRNARESLLPDGGEVRSQTAIKDGYIEIKIADSGQGMRSNMIEAFNEGRPSLSTKDPGRGSGLDTVRGLVKKNGGTIEAASKSGEGTTFTLRLPIAIEPGSGQAIRLSLAPPGDNLSGVLGAAGNGEYADKDNKYQNADEQKRKTGHDQSPSLLSNVATTNAPRNAANPEAKTSNRNGPADTNCPIANTANTSLPTSNNALASSNRCVLPNFSLSTDKRLPQEGTPVKGDAQPPAPAAGANETAAVAQLITDNIWLKMLFSRIQGPGDNVREMLGVFLNRDHPLKEEVFGAIDKLSDDEILNKADEFIRKINYHVKGYYGAVSPGENHPVSSFRQLFIYPTAGCIDMPQTIMPRLAFGQNSVVDFMIKDKGIEYTKEMLGTVYTWLKAMKILSEYKDLALIQSQDIDGLVCYLDGDVWPDTVHNFMALRDLFDPADMPNKIASAKNFLTIISKLEERNPKWKEAMEPYRSEINALNSDIDSGGGARDAEATQDEPPVDFHNFIRVKENDVQPATDATSALCCKIISCRVVAAFNPRTKQRYLGHLYADIIDQKKMLRKLFKDISGTDWKIAVITKKEVKAAYGSESDFSYDGIRNFLVLEKDIKPDNVIWLEGSPTTILGFSLMVEIVLDAQGVVHRNILPADLKRLTEAERNNLRVYDDVNLCASTLGSESVAEKKLGMVTQEEMRAAVDDINRIAGENIFDESHKSKVVRKISEMGLIRGKSVLVVGPGRVDFLPILLARLGLKVVAIDTDHSKALSFELFCEKYRKAFGLTLDNLVTFSSYDKLAAYCANDRHKVRFDYVTLLGVAHYVTGFFGEDTLTPAIITGAYASGTEMPASLRDIVQKQSEEVYVEKMSSMLRPIAPLLNLDGCRIFVNSPGIEDWMKIGADSNFPPSAKTLYYLQKAMLSLEKETRAGFALQPEMDMNDFSMDPRHLDERRRSAVYRVVTVTRSVEKIQPGDPGQVRPPDFVFVDGVIEKLRQAGGTFLKDPDITVERLLAIAPRIETSKEPEEILELIIKIRNLIESKALWGQDRGSAKTRAFECLPAALKHATTIPRGLWFDVIDALMQFTDIRAPDRDAGVFDQKYYESYWPWVLACSINGGAEGINKLNEMLKKVGDETFDYTVDPIDNNHWSAAFQEILLEGILLARTYSDSDVKLKEKVLQGAQNLKSPHAVGLARNILNKELASSRRHSIRDHNILLLYRDERIRPKEEGVLPLDYTRAVFVDKEPLLAHYAALAETDDAKVGPAAGVTRPTEEDARKKFGQLDAMIGRDTAYNTAIGDCGKSLQNLKDVSRLRLAIPIEVLKNSVDITLVLRKKLALLKVPFRLEVTGVREEDEALVNNLREKLVLAENENAENLSNVTVISIKESDIRSRAEKISGLVRIEMPAMQLRVEAIKQLSLAGAGLDEKEYMAIVTDIVPDAQAQKLADVLKDQLADNVSIRIMTSSDPSNSLFMLSGIITSWLSDIKNGSSSTILSLPAIVAPREMMERLSEAVRGAWTTLVAA